MSFATILGRLSDARDAIVSALTGKGVDASGHGFEDFASDIASISGGGGTEEKTVIFYDYDGTELYSYTPTEFAALSAMPANPSHTGLVAQGWNWTLANAKTYVATYEALNIGQLYVPQSGATEIDVTVDFQTLSPSTKWYVNGTIEIDWGDNTTHDIVTGTSTSTAKYASHTYAAAGDYTIKIYASSGTEYDTSGGQAYAPIFYSVTSGSLSSNGNQKYMSAVKAIRFGNGFINAGGYTCYHLHNLEYVTFPVTMTSMSNSGRQFHSCYHLKHINIPSCTGGVATSSFDCCYNLKSCSIGEVTGTRTASSAFSSCYSLKSITVPPNIALGSNFASGCQSMEYATFAVYSSTTVSGSVFSGCSRLRKVRMPSTITTIQSSAFSGCPKLTDINMPSTLTTINTNAFQSDTSIRSIALPSITTIANYAFSGATSLETVDLPQSVQSVGMNAFNQTGIKSIVLPNTSSNYGSYAFSGCKWLKEVTFPSNMTYISQNMFSSCTGLEKINNLPETLTNIDANAFNGCTALTEITIPKNVTQIGSSAFTNCNSLLKAVMMPTTPPTAANNPFTSNVDANLVIYVPYSADHSVLNAYKTAQYWSAWANNMVEMAE